MAKTIALIFAGGTGERMGASSVPKQFLQVGGKPIIAHTIEVFQAHINVAAIVVVCLSDWIERLRETCNELGLTKVVSIVPGGDSGQQSIYRGVCAIEAGGIADPADVILVHDGVRPLIDKRTISACINSVLSRGCTAVTAPAVETVIVEENGHVAEIVNRDRCRLARAPQGFRFKDFLNAHRMCQERNTNEFIDSISLMAHCGYEIFTVEGPAENIKITTKRDFFAFKGYMDMREMGQLWNRD